MALNFCQVFMVYSFLDSEQEANITFLGISFWRNKDKNIAGIFSDFVLILSSVDGIEFSYIVCSQGGFD